LDFSDSFLSSSSWSSFLFRFVVVSGVAFSGEAFADGGGPVFVSQGFDEFVLGERDCLRHYLREVGEGFGGFGLEATGGDGFKDAADGPGEIGGGDVVALDFVAKVDADLHFGELSGFFASVGKAEVRMGGMAEIVAAAAVGKRQGTETGAKTGEFGRHGSSYDRLRFGLLGTAPGRRGITCGKE